MTNTRRESLAVLAPAWLITAALGCTVEGHPASTGASDASRPSHGAGADADAGADGSARPATTTHQVADSGPRPRADIVAVATSGSAGAYTFNVSIESDDIDCTQFANWWEVLSPDGALIYRRILEHSHTDDNGTSDPDAPGNTFTRSGGPVDVQAGDEVIVRAHMSTGGYHGMAMRGSASAGFSAALDIGSTFAADLEDDDPQPTSCAF